MATIFGDILGYTFVGARFVNAGDGVATGEYWVVFSNTVTATPNVYPFRGGSIWWDSEGATCPVSGMGFIFSVVPPINAL